MQDLDLPFKNKFDLVVTAAIDHEIESFYFVYGSRPGPDVSKSDK